MTRRIRTLIKQKMNVIGAVVISCIVMTATYSMITVNTGRIVTYTSSDTGFMIHGVNTISQEVINITLVSPENGAIIRSTEEVNVSVDPLPESVCYSWDTADYSKTVNQSSYTGGYFLLPVPESSGTHSLYLRANNSAGVITEASWSFEVNDHSVFFTLIFPAENGYYQSGTPINVTFDPAVPPAVLYHWDGNTPSSLLQPLPQGDGIHVLHISAEREAGGWDEVEYVFHTDDTPAKLVLTVVNGTRIESRTPVDYISDSDLVEIFFSWDGGINASHPGKIPDTSGWHELRAITIDRANNTASYYYRFYSTLKIELVDPVLITPGNWQVNFSTELDQPEVHTVDNLTFSIDGHVFINTAVLPVLDFSSATDTVVYNWWLNMTKQGSNNTVLTASPSEENVVILFQVWANDTEGNWATLLVNMTTDDTPPVINAVSHVNGSKLPGNTALSFYYNEPLQDELYSWDGTDNQSSTVLPDNIGHHELFIYASDWAGNWMVVKYSYYSKILIDLNQSIGIVNGTILKGGTVISINCTPEPDAIYCTWDDGDSYTVPQPLPAVSGWHVLNVSARDAEGNIYTAIFHFLTELEISLLNAVNNTVLRPGTAIHLNFSETPSIVLYSWDYGEKSSKIDEIQVPVSEGEHWLIVDAENSDYSHGTSWFRAYFVFFTDGSPPQITSVSHENASRVNSGTVIDINFDEEAVLNCSWDGMANDSLPAPVPAGDGWHVLIISATDILGNSACYEYNYLVDDTPVSMYLHSPANGSIVEAGSPVNITFSETPVETLYNINNSTVNKTSLDECRLPWGNATITLRVYTSDGLNWAVANYVFITVDYLVTINLLSPANGTRMTVKALREVINITFTEPVVETVYCWNGGENQTSLAVPDQDGTHVLTVSVLDRSQIWVSREFVFITDSTGPLLKNVIPAFDSVNHTINRGEYSEITFVFNENVTGGYYQWNATGSKNLFANTGSAVMQIPVPKKPGYYVLSLNVTDDLGNSRVHDFDLVIYLGHGVSMLEEMVNMILILAVITGPPLTVSAAIKGYKRFKKQ